MLVEALGLSVNPKTADQFPNINFMKKRRLLSVHWELTADCNQRCTHCYLDHQTAAPELSTTECCMILDQLADEGILNITFSGGEPLTRPDFFDIARYARQKRFNVRIFSNGILVDEQRADQIAALYPFSVSISLYGIDAATHDGITQVGRSFERTVQAAKLLRARGVRVELKTPLMRENARQFQQMNTLARELDCAIHFDLSIAPMDNGDRTPLKHRLQYNDLLWLFRSAFDQRRLLSRRIDPQACTCSLGEFSALIDPSGVVYPCVNIRIAAGSLRAQSISEIWNSSPLWASLRSLTGSALQACSGCSLANLCNRCHGLAYKDCGDLYAPSLANCQVALARRQVFVEQGLLAPDFPIPEHLKALSEKLITIANPTASLHFPAAVATTHEAPAST